MKKSIGKGASSKAKKKQVEAEIERLKDELNDRQQLERNELEKDLEDSSCVGELTERLPELQLEEQAIEASAESLAPQQSERKKKKKKNKLLENYEKKRAEALLEMANSPSLRDVEQKAIEAKVEALGMSIVDIIPDGHCL
jgi:DNA repair exonuclease SbcCD ATPase subunit